jgi:hypothetical protein
MCRHLAGIRILDMMSGMFAGTQGRCGLGHWLRLCLIVSLWQAPLPWIDFHGGLSVPSDLPACSISQVSLAHHLSRYHSELDPFHPVPCRWHLHVSLPSESQPDGPADNASPIPGLPSGPCEAEFCPQSGERVLWDNLLEEIAAANPNLAWSAIAPDYELTVRRSGPWNARSLASHNFLQSFSAGLFNSHALLGVARC